MKLPELQVLKTGTVTWEVPSKATPYAPKGADSPGACLVAEAVRAGIIVYRVPGDDPIILMTPEGGVYAGYTVARARAFIEGWTARGVCAS